MTRTIESGSSFRYCGRAFSGEEIAWIRDLIAGDNRRTRAELSRLVSKELRWLRPDGRTKDMACRVAMLRMERDALISLPPPRQRNGNGRIHPRLTPASDPREPVTLPAGALGEIHLQPVETPGDSSLWNEMIERHHYLGYKPLPGAQIRYLIHGGGHLLALLGFGAASWKVGFRDRFIGWSAEERVKNLHLVVNNARSLILPWVTSKNLASRILGAVARRLPLDWETRYGYRPVLLETYVERDRFRGTSYRAANWISVGITQGRGKLDREHRRSLPVKEILLYPLCRDFRRRLRSFN